MLTVFDVYEEVKEVYLDELNESQYTKLQCLYAMIEVFAPLIAQGHNQRAMFYASLLMLMRKQSIDELECQNLIASYKKAIKLADYKTKCEIEIFLK